MQATLARHAPMKLFMKPGCPFCSKLAVFLGEANLMDKVSFEPDDAKNRSYIAEKCGKTTFPAMEYAPGSVMLESDDIINKFASENNVDISKLKAFNFVFGADTDETMMKNFIKLKKYGVKKSGLTFPELLVELKKPETLA